MLKRPSRVRNWTGAKWKIPQAAWLTLTRQLLALRQQHRAVLPDARRHNGRAAPHRFVAVSWQPAGQLSLALNIGQQSQPLPAMPGETLFAWPQESGELPQHSLIVRRQRSSAMSIPTATYRIQFRNGMTFDRAQLVPYAAAGHQPSLCLADLYRHA